MKNLKKQQMTVNCKCGEGVILQALGGQYQYTYSGVCDCGRRWELEDLTEDLSEDSSHD
jgi:hypothetical protein